MSEKDTLKQLKELQQKFDQLAQKTCPSCGHCPTCGHTPYRAYPQYPWYPTPYWYYQTTGGAIQSSPATTISVGGTASNAEWTSAYLYRS